MYVGYAKYKLQLILLTQYDLLPPITRVESYKKAILYAVFVNSNGLGIASTVLVKQYQFILSPAYVQSPFDGSQFIKIKFICCYI